MSDADPFLAEAERRGLLTAAQSADCRRIAEALREVQIDLSIDEIAARKGFVTTEDGAEIRRALARLRVGRYEVIERLGEGAAGVVWKARDTKLDRVVALKVLSQKAQVAPTFRERFLREARIAVTLNDVNIVRGLDYGEADGYQYFAMEFVDGGNAETKLARVGRIPEAEAASMALDVVRALQYVQKFHIVHRDIKPSNLLLTPTGHVKLCDLGLAKPMLAESELLAGDGSTAGTPFYMSPEQIREPEKIDWKSDVYSLGATLYHLLTGVPPFRPDGQTSVIQKHLREKPRNPREHVLEISDGAASVVMRMMLKDPAERYASLEELRGDLEAVIEGRTPLHTAPPVPPEEATAERHARIAVARRINEKNLPREQFPWIAVAMLVMLAGAVLAVSMGMNLTKPSTPASPPAAKSPETAAAPTPKAPDAATPESPKTAPVVPPKPSGPDPAAERAAKDAFDECRTLANQRAEAAHFTSAIAMLNAFAAAHADTEAAKSVPAEVARIETIAVGRVDELLKAAKDSALRHRFDDAHVKIEQAKAVDIKSAGDRAEAGRTDVESIHERYDRDRTAQADGFVFLYGGALLCAGEDMAAARAIVDRDAPKVPAYDDEVSALRDDLDLLAKEGANPDIDRTTTKGALALLLSHLSQREMDDARDDVESVRATQGDVALARARVAAVERVLMHRAAAELAGAEQALASNHPEVAQRAAEAAQRVYAGYAPATVMLARVRLAQNDPDQAVVLLQGVTRRADAPAEAHYWLALAFAKRPADFARAESEMREFLDAAARDDPLRGAAATALETIHGQRVEGDVKKWRDIAKSLTGKGKREVEEGAWGRVAELRPDDAEALIALGRIYIEKKLWVPAYVALSRVGKGSSQDAQKTTDAQKKRGAELLGQIKGSGFPSEDGRGFASDAEKYYASENWDKAIQNFQAALLVSPHLYTARLRLTRAYLARLREKASPDDAHAAADAATVLVASFPDDAMPLALRADARLAAGDLKGARDDAAKAADLDARCAAAQLALGRVRLAASDVAKAILAFEAANGIEPSADALFGLAAAYLARAQPGDRATAAEMLTNAKRRYVFSTAQRTQYDELVKALEDAK